MDIDLDKLLEEKDEYDDFVEKFKHERTTDDCFTPPEVYEKVKNGSLTITSSARARRLCGRSGPARTTRL